MISSKIVKLKNCLANNQYYWFHLYINQATEQGDILLSAEEIKFGKIKDI